jgi:hypothetical protein
MMEMPVDETLVDDTVRLVLACGTTSFTCPSPDAASWSLTFVVIVRTLVEAVVAAAPPPPPVWFARTVSVFVPRLVMALCTVWAEPFPTASRRMTEPTPIVTPSSVSTERSLFAVTPRIADRRISKRLISRLPPSLRPYRR